MKLESSIMMMRFVIITAVVTGSQAFFSPAATSATRSRSSSRWLGGNQTPGGKRCATDAWTEKRRSRRGRADELRANSLEEVPESLVDKLLLLEEEGTGKTLECYAERFAVVDGNRYLAAFPKDPAVAIAFEESGEVAPVPIADPLMDRLFPLAEATIKDCGPGVTLLRTPVSLTVRGLDVQEGDPESGDFDLDDDDDDKDEVFVKGREEDEEEDEDEEDDDDDDDDDDYDDGEQEFDEVELLGELTLEDEEFLLVRFMEPLLILSRETEDGRFVLVDEEEDEMVNPVIEDMLSADAL